MTMLGAFFPFGTITAATSVVFGSKNEAGKFKDCVIASKGRGVSFTVVALDPGMTKLVGVMNCTSQIPPPPPTAHQENSVLGVNYLMRILNTSLKILSGVFLGAIFLSQYLTARYGSEQLGESLKTQLTTISIISGIGVGLSLGGLYFIWSRATKGQRETKAPDPLTPHE